jgi:autotransporter-associated beta strand protein
LRNISGANTWSGAITLASNARINSDAGSLALTGGITNAGFTTTVGGAANTSFSTAAIAGAGGLTKDGNGTLTLNFANTYTGATTVSAGTLAVTANDALGTTAAGTTVASGATLDFRNVAYTTTEALTINGGTLAASSGTSSFAGNVTLGNDSTASVAGTQLTLSGVVSDGGNIYDLTKTGAGILVLSGTNTYTGDTIVSAGTLTSGAADVIADTSAVSVASGATWNLNGNSDTVGSLAGAGNVTLGAATLTAGGDGTSTTFSGVVSGSGGLTKAGAGTLTLSGTNTYTGTTTVSAGTLTSGAAGVIADTSAVSVTGGATWDLNGNAETVGSLAGAGNVTLGAATLTAGGDGTSTAFSGVLSGTGGLTKAGAGTLTLSGTNTYTGTTTVSAGTLTSGAADVIADTSAVSVASGATWNLNGNADTVGSLAGAGNVTLGAATLTAGGDNSSTTFSGVMSGTGALSKAGSGTLILSGANTYTGTTTVSAGTLQSANAAALGTVAAGTTVASGAALEINNVNIGTEALDIQGSGVGSTGALVGTGAGAQAGGTVTLSGNATLGGTGTLTLTGVVSGGNALTKDGTGTLYLNQSANTYTGQTTINRGTLKIDSIADGGSNSSLGATIAATPIVLGDGTNAATLEYLGTSGETSNRQISVTAGSAGTIKASNAGFTDLTLSGAVANNGSGLTVDVTSGTLTASGVISGAGALTKTGTGTLYLNQSANTYTGQTTVGQGTLQITALANGGANSSLGATAAGTAIVLGDGTNSATLDYQGTTGETSNRQINVTAGSAGTIKASNAGFSDLTLSGAVANNGSGLTVDVTSGTLTATGVISGTGTLTKTGTGTLYLNQAANTYTGQTTIGQGTLQVSSLANGGANSSLGATVAGTAIVLGDGTNAATLDYRGTTGESSNRQISVTAGSDGTIKTSNAGFTDLTLSGAVANNGSGLTVDVTSGTLTATGVISGTGTLTKSGTGTLYLNQAANTYTGQTTIGQGTLKIDTLADGGVSSSLGATSAGSAIVLGDGTNAATLDYQGTTGETSNRQFATTAGSTGTFKANNAGFTDLTLSGAVANNGTSMTYDVTSGTLYVDGTISGAGSVATAGTGTVVFPAKSSTLPAGYASIGVLQADPQFRGAPSGPGQAPTPGMSIGGNLGGMTPVQIAAIRETLPAGADFAVCAGASCTMVLSFGSGQDVGMNVDAGALRALITAGLAELQPDGKTVVISEEGRNALIANDQQRRRVVASN